MLDVPLHMFSVKIHCLLDLDASMFSCFFFTSVVPLSAVTNVKFNSQSFLIIHMYVTFRIELLFFFVIVTCLKVLVQ